MALVVIIDDDSVMCKMLTTLVAQHGHTAVSAQTLRKGLSVVRDNQTDLVFLDVGLPDGDGLAHIQQIAQSPSKPEVIIMTGLGDPDGAEFAILNGAWDYIEKCASTKTMVMRMLRALEYRAAKRPEPHKPALDRTGIIGESQAIGHALDQLLHTTFSDAGVLITGETGTGKELFAQAVHRNSPRKAMNFVVVDCAALPHTLVESILFGHVKGAFTGADTSREGLVAQADGGTLFLDEIGEMPLVLQKTFLRVLETQRYRPIGGKAEKRSNFRIVASTNRDLEEMVRQGKFRGDLLYRLRTFHLHLPALRQRREDIPLLAHYHLDRLNRLYGGPHKELSTDLLDLLERHEWPGNVRELVNAIDGALSAGHDEATLFSCHLPAALRAQLARKKLKGSQRRKQINETMAAHHPLPPLQRFRDLAIDQAETRYLNALMTNTNGSITSACATAGISRSRLYELMKKHAITQAQNVA